MARSIKYPAGYWEAIDSFHDRVNATGLDYLPTIQHDTLGPHTLRVNGWVRSIPENRDIPATNNVCFWLGVIATPEPGLKVSDGLLLVDTTVASDLDATDRMVRGRHAFHYSYLARQSGRSALKFSQTKLQVDRELLSQTQDEVLRGEEISPATLLELYNRLPLNDPAASPSEVDLIDFYNHMEAGASSGGFGIRFGA